MCGSMVDIQCATAEIGRGKEKRKKKKISKKPQGKNIMSASATQGGHKNRDAWRNGPVIKSSKFFCVKRIKILDQTIHRLSRWMIRYASVFAQSDFILTSVVLLLSTIYGTEWPIMCWCAVKKLLTHSLRTKKRLLSATPVSAIAACPTRSCTGSTFLGECRSNSEQLSLGVCNPELHSRPTWWNAAFRSPTSPVSSICGLPAATSCSYLVTGVRSSVLLCAVAAWPDDL